MSWPKAYRDIISYVPDWVVLTSVDGTIIAGFAYLSNKLTQLTPIDNKENYYQCNFEFVEGPWILGWTILIRQEF